MFDFFKKNEEEDKRKEEEKKFNFDFSISKLKETISKTSDSIVSSVVSAVEQKEFIDDDVLDEIEENLIKADLGLETTIEIVEKLRNKKNQITTDEIKNILHDELISILNKQEFCPIEIKENQLNIILVTGVNGAGKTTLIGKMANRYRIEGKKVIIAAGDTFRAAAEEQLEIWSNRAGAHIVRNVGADPASVVFDAIKIAKDSNADILLIDTAGRLQNKLNLMEELRKIKKVIDKEAPDQLIEYTFFGFKRRV